MNAREPYADLEVRQFLEGLPRHLTYSELAERCLERFGPARAWSRSKIVRYWYSAHDKRGRPFKFQHDAKVRDFIDDRLGRITLTALAAGCRATFGRERAPSRSALQRYKRSMVDSRRGK